MAGKGKKYRESAQKVDKLKRYTFEEAIQLAIDCAYAGFNESLDVAIKLGVDPRHADQMVRGTVALPNGVGKEVRVAVFAKGEKEKEAMDAGADYAGSDDLVEKVQGGWLDFDKTIATPDMMGTVGKLGRVLGPRGLMPNAKLGTVTFDVARAVTEIKAGKIDFKVDKTGIVHAALGKMDFGLEKLMENVASFVNTIQKTETASQQRDLLQEYCGFFDHGARR